MTTSARLSSTSTTTSTLKWYSSTTQVQVPSTTSLFKSTIYREKTKMVNPLGSVDPSSPSHPK